MSLRLHLAELEEYIEFACTTKACAPPPVGTGGSNPGGGGKAVARMSAHPENRRKPIPGFMMDLSDDDLNEARELGYGEGGFRAAAVAAFTGDLGNGFRSVVTESDNLSIRKTGSNTLPIKGVILNADGTKVGEFERTFVRDERTLFVQHDLLSLNPKAQNQGLADRFNARAIAVYQAMGVDRIVLDAALTHGGYAWARQGFRISAPAEERHAIIARLASGKREDDYGTKTLAITNPTREDRAEMAALVEASKNGADIQPIHIASIGENRPRVRGSWYGKDLLMGDSWPGVFYFDRANPVTASAVQLEYADLRPKWRS